MSNRALLILIAGILAIHAVLIFLLFVGTGTENTKTPRTEVVQTAEPSAKSPTVSFPETGDDPDVPEQPAPAVPSAVAPQTPSAAAVAEKTNKIKQQPAVSKRDTMSVLSMAPPKTLRFDKAVSAINSIPETIYAKAGILVDMDSGRVLWARNPGSPVCIASMTKIMTLLLAYEAYLANPDKFSLDGKVAVTKEASNVPPSSVALVVGEAYPLRDLMRAAAVRSANDAAFLIGQYIGDGSIDKFIGKMNARAKELGMSNTNFFNPNGLPGKSRAFDNQASVSDMVRLCDVFMRYDELMSLTGLRAADFRSPGDKKYIRMQNHNNLLPGAKVGTVGVDGIKTGFTNRAQSCVAASCKRGGKRLLVVLAGVRSAQERDYLARHLLNWGYTCFHIPLPKAEQDFEKASEAYRQKAAKVGSKNTGKVKPRSKKKNR